tara:strand:- start:32 stop:634 length:603 start_codon:yes stop_codon:yes gene_type:complete
MIRIIKKIPHNITIACSGGIDSMVFVDFLLKGKRKVKLAYFNHDTFYSQTAQNFVQDFATKNNLKLLIGKVQGVKGRRSMEEFWRDERYHFLNKINSDFTITCHHLDDCVETWVMSSLHGQGKLIPYKRNSNVYRPFLMTSKKTIKKYAEAKNVKWVEDPSNQKCEYSRNYVRNIMMSHILKINPGIRTTIRKKLIENYL